MLLLEFVDQDQTPARSIGFKLDGMKQRPSFRRYFVTQGCLYIWQSLKNCVKLLIGRKPYRDARLVFLRQYILHRLGLRPIGAITCNMNEAEQGAGAQGFQVMSTINFARASGLPYLHSPFKHIAHADRPMQEWIAAWESVFNLGAGELPFDGRARGVLIYGYRVMQDSELCFGWQDRKEELQECFRSLIPEFRRKYYLNKSPRTTDEVTVAVHVRRGDVTTDYASYKYTSTERVLRIAGAVKAILDAHAVPASIRIYSEGDEKEFAELSPLGTEFFLNADPIWTFQELVEADIFVTARSYFSLCAGFLSDGIKIIEEPWTWTFVPAPEDWIRCKQEGLFNSAAFERQLTLLLQAKEKARTTGSLLTSQ